MRFDAVLKTLEFSTGIMKTSLAVILIITVQSLCLDSDPTITTVNNDSKDNTFYNTKLVAAQNTVTASLMNDEIKSQLLKLQSQISPNSLDLLSPDVLSVEDPLEYLIRKTKHLSPLDIAKTMTDVKFVLNSNTLLQNYIPYVEALKAILECQMVLTSVKQDLLKIQEIRASNPEDSSLIPSDISSPPELFDTGLFSSDIFSDPDTPLRLVRKLLQIPIENTLNLRTRLKNFANRVKESNTFTGQVWWLYIGYCYDLNTFFMCKSALKNLKRDIKKLQSIIRSDSPEQFSQHLGQTSNGHRLYHPQTSNPSLAVDSTPSDVLSSGGPSTESSCGVLHQSEDMIELPNILSPDVFSQADIFHYFIKKIVNISLWKKKILLIQDEVHNALERKQLPACYTPYATLLSSILQCCNFFSKFQVDSFIRGIHMRRSKNINGFNSLPLDISSSPELSAIFSSEIFSNPESPVPFLKKMSEMRSDEITNLKMQLQNFLEKWKEIDVQEIPFPYWYTWYAKSVFKFLQDGSVLDDLKKHMAEMQHWSASGEKAQS